LHCSLRSLPRPAMMCSGRKHNALSRLLRLADHLKCFDDLVMEAKSARPAHCSVCHGNDDCSGQGPELAGSVIPRKATISQMELSAKFKNAVSEIFSSNLVFAFVFGGFAKGYATSDHDIDMFVCLDHRDAKQEILFRKFYFSIHSSFALPPDHQDPGEVMSLPELRQRLAHMDRISMSPILEDYDVYEGIVWVDCLAGQVLGEVGDIALLHQIKFQCSGLVERWRTEILERCVGVDTLRLESEEILKLGFTRLCRRFVTYLQKLPGHTPQKYRVCILGGGGNVAEAAAAHFGSNGHDVCQFRFPSAVVLPGVPVRPPRSPERLSKLNVEGREDSSQKSMAIPFIGASDFGNVDVFVFALPSFMAEPMADALGKALSGKFFVNLSDRFLGSYTLMARLVSKHGSAALPQAAVAFNGTPIMAIKDGREGPCKIYFVKQSHAVAIYPQTRAARTTACSLLLDLFQFPAPSLRLYRSMFHLAFECAHCVEHAVMDLLNIKVGRYDTNEQEHKNQTCGLYHESSYTDSGIKIIEDILRERDAISRVACGHSFMSLKDYDVKVFDHGSPTRVEPGTVEYRTKHTGLSSAPPLSRSTAFGYEDVLCCLVPLESFAGTLGVRTPKLSTLIDQWCAVMEVDYRAVGRTISSLGLSRVYTQSGPPEVSGWLPETFAADTVAALKRRAAWLAVCRTADEHGHIV